MAAKTTMAKKVGEDYSFSPMTENEAAMMQPMGQPISLGAESGFSPMTADEAAMMQPMGQPISMTDTGYTTPAEPSMWSKIGDWAGQNKDLLLAGAMAYNDYAKQQKAADVQSGLNQAYAKWSGFSPNLMQNVKPVEYPDIATSAMNAFKAGPILWNDLAKMYEARKKGQLDEYLNEEKNREALRQGIASKGVE